jgi:hypothetical protein
MQFEVTVHKKEENAADIETTYVQLLQFFDMEDVKMPTKISPRSYQEGRWWR